MLIGRLAVLSLSLLGAVQIGAAQQTIVLHASTVLDGRGATLGDRNVIVRDGISVGVMPGGPGGGDARYEFGNYTDDGFAQMWHAWPLALEMFKQALCVPGLKIVFGTDVLAAAHGRNYQELLYRIEKGGQDAMAAVVSATSLAAEALGLETEIGSIASGYVADLIALDGNPAQDQTALARVLFVMKDSVIFKNEGANRVRELR